jgi:hypothetical protein
VAFDAVLLLNPNGNATVNLFGLGGGCHDPDGHCTGGRWRHHLSHPGRVLVPVAGSSSFDRYTWNMWPRFGAGNNAQISDFAPNEAAGAPDAANAPVSIPEPSTLAIAALGLAALAGRRRNAA